MEFKINTDSKLLTIIGTPTIEELMNCIYDLRMKTLIDNTWIIQTEVSYTISTSPYIPSFQYYNQTVPYQYPKLSPTCTCGKNSVNCICNN